MTSSTKSLVDTMTRTSDVWAGHTDEGVSRTQTWGEGGGGVKPVDERWFMVEPWVLNEKVDQVKLYLVPVPGREVTAEILYRNPRKLLEPRCCGGVPRNPSLGGRP